MPSAPASVFPVILADVVGVCGAVPLRVELGGGLLHARLVAAAVPDENDIDEPLAPEAGCDIFKNHAESAFTNTQRSGIVEILRVALGHLAWSVRYTSIMSQSRLNPFVPGRGALPPYLAGREAEQQALMGIFAYVEAGRGAPRDVVLCGPRGNGKTVLLRWFQREIEALDGQIDLLWRTPSDLPSVDALATTLVPPRRFKSMLPDTLSLSVGVGRAGWDLRNDPGTLAELLTLRCRQRPLVVLLDEAHTLDRVVGQALLNASQSVSAAAPFLLVLAGTPGLEPRLHAMSATFWDRAEHLAIGLLEPAASAAALTRPFGAETPSVMFEDAALQQVLDDSQCYPYFLQLFGAALWDVVVADGKTMIDDAIVARATAIFDQKKGTYYRHRRNELQRAGLLEMAAALADAFCERASMAQAEVDAAIVQAQSGIVRDGSGDARGLESLGPTSPIRVRDHLAAVGYVWNPPGEGDVWRPGIPSLMRHIGIAAPTAPGCDDPDT